MVTPIWKQQLSTAKQQVASNACCWCTYSSHDLAPHLGCGLVLFSLLTSRDKWDTKLSTKPSVILAPPLPLTAYTSSSATKLAEETWPDLLKLTGKRKRSMLVHMLSALTG